MAEARDKHVGQAVVVVIADRHSHRIAGAVQPAGVGNLAECAVGLLMEEPIGHGLVKAARPAVADLQDVQAAVVVVVEQGDATGGDFGCRQRAIRPVDGGWR